MNYNNEIARMAKDFREAILKAKIDGKFSHSALILMREFPKGCCTISCDLLGRYFYEKAHIKSWYTSGEVGENSHAWLTLHNNFIVDITGDQYKNNRGTMCYNIPVYVGEMDAFHRQFQMNGSLIEYSPNLWTPDFMGETSVQRIQRICYEIVLKYLN